MRARRGRGKARGPRVPLSWLVLLALFLAPLLVNLTHGPASMATAAEVAAHGHAHAEADHGPFAGHDATDHEHQLQALPEPGPDHPAWREPAPAPGEASAPPGLIREGPRRPPRLV